MEDGGEKRALRLTHDTVLRLLGSVLLLVGVLGFVQGGYSAIQLQEPIDLDLNLVAGERLLDGEDLYDPEESRRAALELGGPSLRGSHTSPTNGFAGAPPTALIHAPFTLLDHDTGVALFRLAALVGMVAAVGITALALPEGARLTGSLLGLGALASSTALVQTLQLGQGHEFVMLGMAVGLWGVSRERWGVAGAGFALAAVLKISPVCLLAYLLLRGRRQALVSAVGVGAGLTVVAATIGRPTDLIVWLRDIVPGLSGGVERSLNQSLPAFLARVWSGDDLGSTASIGAWRFLALPLVVGVVVALARTRTGRAVDPLDLGVLILVSLLAGPLSWAHYSTWAVLPIVLLADPRRWDAIPARTAAATLAAIAVALLLLTTVAGEPEAASFAERLASGPNVVALILLVGASLALPLGRNRSDEPVRASAVEADVALTLPSSPVTA